jgi:hypothetical protein
MNDKSILLVEDNHVRKPANFAEFTKVVRQFGLYWLMLNEPPLCPRSLT